MKKFFIFCGILCASVIGKAQNIYTGTIEYNKTSYQGTISEYNFTDKQVGDALFAEVEKVAGKSKSSKGFQLYKGVQIKAISADVLICI